MSVQYVAAASQKFTWPVVTPVVPAATAATKVNSLPELRDPPDDREFDPELIVKAVLVGTDADAGEIQQRNITISVETRGTKANLAVFRAYSILVPILTTLRRSL